MSTKAELMKQLEAQRVTIDMLRKDIEYWRNAYMVQLDRINDLKTKLDLATKSNRQIATEWVECHGDPGTIDQLTRLLDYVSGRAKV